MLNSALLKIQDKNLVEEILKIYFSLIRTYLIVFQTNDANHLLSQSKRTILHYIVWLPITKISQLHPSFLMTTASYSAFRRIQT